MTGARVRVDAPGRVNLLGEYTDLVDGLVLPVATDLTTRIEGTVGGPVVELWSATEPKLARVPLDISDPHEVEPGWARFVAGVVMEVRPATGLTGTVVTDLPVGAGLSSSAALTVAVSLALGAEGDGTAVAQLARRAEQRATGVPCGIMDQLASTSGVAGHALLIDCHGPRIEPVPVPEDLEIRVIHSGVTRRLSDSAYAERKAAIDRAGELLGPLRLMTDLTDLERIDDPMVRRRARHVVSENLRVRRTAEALASDDRPALGELMAASQRSMREDLEISLPVIDALIERLTATPGVVGARLTGAGFGGCVVVLTEPDVLREGWRIRPSGGARHLDEDEFVY